MVVTVLEGEVADDQAIKFKSIYNEALYNLEPGILNTYLVRDINNGKNWKIITVWNSKDDIDKMRKLGTPKGVLMFRSVGVEPELTLLDVVESSISD